jgi:carboxyl-terminal processing protease
VELVVLVVIVVLVVSRFVEEGQVLNIRDSYGNVDIYPVVSQDETNDLPMVVLVDNYSASGSEVSIRFRTQTRG